jgi:orotate phosphoribosyltransferase
MQGVVPGSAGQSEEAASAQQFVGFALAAGVLKFGQFKTKAGRISPYFFNAGLFDDGAKLGKLAEFYARDLLRREAAGAERFDMIFGPAYKGIPLVSAVAIELARAGRNVPFAYNRKEAKDHGEGGSLVGAPLTGKVLIIDDVMSAGTATRESIAIIRAAGATPFGVAIALDRQEKASEGGIDLAHSAVQFVTNELHLKVYALATLADLLEYLAAANAQQGIGGQAKDPLAAHLSFEQHLHALQAYRERYGVD